MEFGTTPQPQGSPDIDDATRLAASTRIRTLEPTHNTVTADELSDDEIVTQHLMQPAAASVANDIEFTEGDQAQNIAPDKPHHIALLVIMSSSLVVAALVAYLFLTFS